MYTKKLLLKNVFICLELLNEYFFHLAIHIQVTSYHFQIIVYVCIKVMLNQGVAGPAPYQMNLQILLQGKYTLFLWTVRNLARKGGKN